MYNLEIDTFNIHKVKIVLLDFSKSNYEWLPDSDDIYNSDEEH